jgi:UbiD family decarboxylase
MMSTNAPADLRAWLAAVEEIGELRTVEAADAELEIGALTEINDEQRGKALLFDRIQGYPAGHRLLASALITSSRMGLTLGVGPAATVRQLLGDLAGRAQQWETDAPKFSPRVVSSGPVMDHCLSGREIDLRQFPAPLWNEQDGGRYLGTGDVVITRDRDTGIVNLGTYRIMVHDEKRLGLYISPSHHGYRHLQQYHSEGKPCPVAISFGHHPVFLVVGGSALRYGQPEYDYAGAILQTPIEVIEGPVTGLPFPAHSELVIEGFVPPGQRLAEGPFGEYTGYYATGRQDQPVIEVEAVYYRDDPIVLGALNCKPPHDYTFLHCVMKSVLVKEGLDRIGVPAVRGVWFHEAAAANFLIAVSIKQLYAGHATQAGTAALQTQVAATGNGRYVVVVDEDIDPTNLEQVIWALGTRSNPSTDINVLLQTFSNKLDPISPAEGERWRSSRAVINACRPFDRIQQFPAVATASEEVRQKVLAKWPEFR